MKYELNNFKLNIIEYYSFKNVIKKNQFYLNNLKFDYNILKQIDSSYNYIHNKINILKINKRIILKVILIKMKLKI